MRRCRFAQHRKRTAVMALCFGCTSMVHETRLAVPLGKEAELRMHEHSFRTPPTHSAPCAFRTCELQGIPPKL